MALPSPARPDRNPQTRSIVRAAIAILFCLSVTLYTAGVVSGFIGTERKIDTVNFAMIAVAILCSTVLLMPEVFQRLRQFEMAGFRLELSERVDQVERAVSAHEQRLTELLMVAMSPPIFRHLCGIACLKTYQYRHFDLWQREMYFLKDHGFIRLKPRYGRVEFDKHFDNRNLVEIAEPTEAGWSIVLLRKEEIPEEFKTDEANIRPDVPSDILEAMRGRQTVSSLVAKRNGKRRGP